MTTTLSKSTERAASTANGILMLLLGLLLLVGGPVGVVENALTDLGDRGVVDLDEDRKAAMVSNLLVVLCADREAQPVVNTGTLYG